MKNLTKEQAKPGNMRIVTTSFSMSYHQLTFENGDILMFVEKHPRLNSSHIFLHKNMKVSIADNVIQRYTEPL